MKDRDDDKIDDILNKHRYSDLSEDVPYAILYNDLSNAIYEARVDTLINIGYEKDDAENKILEILGRKEKE